MRLIKENKMSYYKTLDFWARNAIILLILSALIPISLNKPQSALAYACGNPTTVCVGSVSWSGGTLGGSAYIYMQANSCTPCTNNSYEQNIAIYDYSFAPYAHVEVGYSSVNSNNWYYYYCSITHGGNTYCNNPGPVPSTDFGNFTGFKMTRNRQGAGNVLLQIWSGGSPQFNWSLVLSNNMGGNYGTINSFLGTSIYDQNKVYGDSSHYGVSGTNYTQNSWQRYDGIYIFQTNSGNEIAFGPITEYWSLAPAPGGTGGSWRVNCCY